MPTLILSPRHTANSQKLWRYAIAKGWEVIRLPSFRIPDEWDKNPPEDVAIYGEPLFNAMVAEALGLEMDTPDDDFLVKIGQDLTGRWIQLLTAREARRIDKPTFFKPPLHKTFKAGVYESGAALPDNLEDKDPVLCQEVVKWVDEFRFFILDNRIVAQSCYINSGMFVGDSVDLNPNRAHLQACRDIVMRLLRQSSAMLPPAVVIDAGMYVSPKTDDFHAAIIEANEAPASGLYQCDPGEALRTIRRATRKIAPVDCRDNLSDYDSRPERQCVGKVIEKIQGLRVTFTDGTEIDWGTMSSSPLVIGWRYSKEPPAYKLPK